MSAAEEARAEAEGIASRLVLTDEIVLAVVRSTIKGAFKREQSLANGGAMVYLDDDAEAIWDEAVGISFRRWHASRPITDTQVEAAFTSVLETAIDVTTKDDIRAALEAARGADS